jgi:hypothetical protein
MNKCSYRDLRMTSLQDFPTEIMLSPTHTFRVKAVRR